MECSKCRKKITEKKPAILPAIIVITIIMSMVIAFMFALSGSAMDAHDRAQQMKEQPLAQEMKGRVEHGTQE